MTEGQQKTAIANIKASLPILERLEEAISNGCYDPDVCKKGNPMGPTRNEQLSQINSLLGSSRRFIKQVTLNDENN